MTDMTELHEIVLFDRLLTKTTRNNLDDCLRQAAAVMFRDMHPMQKYCLVDDVDMCPKGMGGCRVSSVCITLRDKKRHIAIVPLEDGWDVIMSSGGEWTEDMFVYHFSYERHYTTLMCRMIADIITMNYVNKEWDDFHDKSRKAWYNKTD